MASTLTRTAAAFAVATLPILAGATAAQASDSSPKRDGDTLCKERNDKNERCDIGKREYPKPEYKHKERDNKEEKKKEYTRPDYKKPDHRKDDDGKHEKKRAHDDKKWEKGHHKKDDDKKWDKKRHHRDDHKKHDRRHHKKHVKYDPLNEVRTATAKYFSVAAAERDGYHRPASGPLRGCITETPGKNSPAMGFHWVNEDLLDAKVEYLKPEALVYEPNSLGKLDLVAVEYVVFKDTWHKAGNLHPPKLFGLDFMLVSAPNRYNTPAFYMLHAWIWKFNPDGTHAAFNPLASCKYASLLPK
jgi:hypothetical protein